MTAIRLLILAISTTILISPARAEETAAFQAGAATCDITPTAPVPMWGYGARHDMLSQGVIEPLRAKAVVIRAGEGKLAIVATDLGRGPTPAMMAEIRKGVAPLGIGTVMVTGSHSHHGPVIELLDVPGKGKGKFDAAVAYSKELPGKIVGVIKEADARLKAAKIGVAAKDLNWNRNRQSKQPVKPTDPAFTVVRIDDAGGKPIASIVHYTAHPVTTDGKILKFSGDYPAFMTKAIEAKIQAPCLFLQGAAGDMSPSPPDGRREPQVYGEALAKEAIGLLETIKPEAPAKPKLQASTDLQTFATRRNLANPLLSLVYERAFFPELVRALLAEYKEGVKVERTTVLLNGEIALVGVPGEFFCSHALRLRERARGPKTVLLVGYCNGHCMYFPTIEAAAEGGYGADPEVSFVALGAGEAVINAALIDLYLMQGKFKGENPPK